MADAMIEFRDVTKRYGALVANDHLSLTIRRGELMTLLGPSGCGKTTALRCLTGMNHPDEGRIFLDGKDVTDVATHRRELGMVTPRPMHSSITTGARVSARLTYSSDMELIAGDIGGTKSGLAWVSRKGRTPRKYVSSRFMRVLILQQPMT